MNPFITRAFAPLLNLCIGLLLLAGSAPSAHAQKPINYQGRVTVGGVNFDGTGQFRFALIDNTAQPTASVASVVSDGAGKWKLNAIVLERGGSGYFSAPSVTLVGGDGSGATATAQVSGGSVTGITVVNGGTGYTSFPAVVIGPSGSTSTVTKWTNDGGGGAVSLAVSKGLYSVALGDTSLPNMTTPIPAFIFNSAPLTLRVWFNDGVHGSQLLSPDQPLTAVPFAKGAETAAYAQVAGFAVNDGAVPRGHQEFTTPGTVQFTVPDGVYRICVDAWGAGGGGGASFTFNSGGFPQTNGGGIGGGGAYSRQMFDLIPGQVWDVTIGAGGAGATGGTPAATGGATSFQLSPVLPGMAVISGGGGPGPNATASAGGGFGVPGAPDPSAAIGRTPAVFNGAVGLVNPPASTGNGGSGGNSIQGPTIGRNGYVLLTW